MKTLSALSFTAVLLILLCPLAHADKGWQQIRKADKRTDVSTYLKNVPNQALDAFMGVTEVHHSMLTVLAVLGDVKNFPSWVFQCDSTEMRLKQWGPDIVRIRINGIWPVSDRDAMVRSTVSQDPKTLAITVHSTAAKGILPPQDGFVRIPALDNHFELEPLPGGWTRVTFRTFVDPGGYIPAWLANFVATRAPLYSLRHMAEQMNKPKYQISSPKQLPLRLPGIQNLQFPST